MISSFYSVHFDYFKTEQEDELEELLLLFARHGFPFTEKKLCQLAYELACKTKRKGFSPEKKAAGRAWLQGYLDRHPRLRKKLVANLSIARAMSANPVQVNKFFELYQKWLKDWKLELSPNHIWNVNESGLGDVPKPQKVIGVTGERSFQTVSGEKPANTTLVTYISAGGVAIPPMVIFKASHVKDEWREAAPSGYFVRCSESGYISADLFYEYGEKFIRFLRENNLMVTGKKHMVLLDLHKSHLFNLRYMQYMKANGVEVCSFPPHCTHILQPLDDTPYGVLKSKYQQELLQMNEWLAGQRISKQQFFRVLVPAYTSAFSMDIIRREWANTGLYPVNPNAAKVSQLGPNDVSHK